MKIVTAISVAMMALVTWVACIRIDEAYKMGYKDGIQYARDLIKYEIYKERRAQCIEDAEHNIPQA